MAIATPGPYASAVLRLQIRFPDIYPDLPPLVTFATDVFHPLIVPLTTYTFSTSSASDNPVSATDEERLPPGGFSLRHGFPHWFGRAKRKDIASGASSRNVSGNSANVVVPPSEPIQSATELELKSEEPSDTPHTSDAVSDQPIDNEDNTGPQEEPVRVAQVPNLDQFVQTRTVVPVYELLEYIRSTFDNEEVLDSLPVESAGNPGAWHAWKAHRRDGHTPGDLRRGSPQARLPGDWHWDGIWARRVETEIETSNSDPMLFGNASRGGDEMVRDTPILSFRTRKLTLLTDKILAIGRGDFGFGEGDDGFIGART